MLSTDQRILGKGGVLTALGEIVIIKFRHKRNTREAFQGEETASMQNHTGRGDLAIELSRLSKELKRQFAGGQWQSLASTLEVLAKVGEIEGKRELCLRAQSMRELMGKNGGGRQHAGQRMQELFADLMFHLSHLQWSSKISH